MIRNRSFAVMCLLLLLVLSATPVQAVTDEEAIKYLTNLRDYQQEIIDAVNSDLYPAKAVTSSQEEKDFREKWAADIPRLQANVDALTKDLNPARRAFNTRISGSSFDLGKHNDSFTGINVMQVNPNVAGNRIPEDYKEFLIRIEEIWDELKDLLDSPYERELTNQYGKIIDRYNTKLIDGFPAMPWEYVVNFSGDEKGPSAWQAIWLHPSLGYELPVNGESDEYNPAFAVQVLGLNGYFFEDSIFWPGYIGAAAIVSFDQSRLSLPDYAVGGIIHWGNNLSAGYVVRDEDEYFFLSSRVALESLSDILFDVFGLPSLKQASTE